ncbi:MAG: DoxX family membrane protein [Patescibacteria group bacterium]
MWQSLRISQLILRLSLAVVFLWFGIDKFFHPGYWLSVWVPQSIVDIAAVFHISANAVVFSIGVMELLVGISLATNMFVGLFALIGALFLITIPFFYGLSEAIIRDFGLIGGLLALVFWPSRTFRNY